MPASPICIEHIRIIYNILNCKRESENENDKWSMTYTTLCDILKNYDEELHYPVVIPEKHRADMCELSTKQPKKVITATKAWLKAFLKANKKVGITGYADENGVYFNERERFVDVYP
jgi:hypothetical protein